MMNSTNNLELKPLEILEQETGYKITEYMKQLELIPIVEPKLSKWQKLKRLLFSGERNICYDYLNNRQKSLLHTIAPLWANIIEHNMEGKIIVTTDNGKRYNLDSMSSRSCLVGEVYGFGETTCEACHEFNMNFASLNSLWLRNASHLQFPQKLAGFLDHYYENHWNNQMENDKP